MELNPAQRASRYEMLSKIDRASAYRTGEPNLTGLDIVGVTFSMSAEILMQAVQLKHALTTRRMQIAKNAADRVRSAANVIRIYRERLAETRRAYRHKLVGEIVPADLWSDDEDRISPDLQVAGFNKAISVPAWVIIDMLLRDENDVLEALKASQPRNVAGRLKHEVADEDVSKIYDELNPLEGGIAAFEKKHKITSDHYEALFYLIHFNEASTGGRTDATGRATKNRELCNFLMDLDAGASEAYAQDRHFKPADSHRFVYNSNTNSFSFQR